MVLRKRKSTLKQTWSRTWKITIKEKLTTMPEKALRIMLGQKKGL